MNKRIVNLVLLMNFMAVTLISAHVSHNSASEVIAVDTMRVDASRERAGGLKGLNKLPDATALPMHQVATNYRATSQRIATTGPVTQNVEAVNRTGVYQPAAELAKNYRATSQKIATTGSTTQNVGAEQFDDINKNGAESQEEKIKPILLSILVGISFVALIIYLLRREIVEVKNETHESKQLEKSISPIESTTKMTHISRLEMMDYSEVFDHVVSSYIREFGERKFKTVFEQVMTSNKISGLIGKLRFKGMPPGSKDILYCLNEIPYFIIARGQTQAVAALIALQRWNEEVNSQQFLLSDEGLHLRAVNIIKESRVTFF